MKYTQSMNNFINTQIQSRDTKHNNLTYTKITYTIKKHSNYNYTSTINFNFFYTYKYNQLIKRAILKNIKIIYIVTNNQITLINQQTISYIHMKNKHENNLHSNKHFKCTHQSINSFLINWCKELHFKKHKNHLHSRKTF